MNKISWNLTDLATIPSNGIKVFETFSCGGGSSLGYKLAGCEVVAANDIDPEMAYHYKLNLNPKHYFLCPVKDLIKKDLPEELYGIDILGGSPPCSSYSVAGNREKDWGKKKHFREGQAAQVLDDLFFDFLDLAERIKPKVIIAENVKGITVGKAKGYVKMIMARLEEIEYQAQLFLVNAADCGVPQKRERVFFVALRNDIKKPKLKLAPNLKWISAGEATKDIQVLTDDEIRNTKSTGLDFKWWHLTRPGERYEDAVLRAGLKSAYFSYAKLHPNLPSPTLVSGNVAHMTHWSERRKLTYREWARLGSFPDDYQVKNDNIGKYLIGMSVPPRMTEQVAKAVIEQWLN